MASTTSRLPRKDNKHPAFMVLAGLFSVIAVVIIGYLGLQLVQKPQSNMSDDIDPILIGVLTMEALGVTETDTRAITERLRLFLGRQQIFTVLERQYQDMIILELGFTSSGAIDSDESVVEVGRLFGVNKMVAGIVSKVGETYSLQVRLIDVETSLVEEHVFSDVTSIDEALKTAPENVARDLAQAVMARLTAAMPPPDI